MPAKAKIVATITILAILILLIICSSIVTDKDLKESRDYWAFYIEGVIIT